MNPSCESVARHWLADCRVRLRPGTVELYSAVAQRWCALHPRLAIRRVGAAELAAYVTTQRSKGRTDTGINIDLAALKAWLRWAAAEGFTPAAPRVKPLRVGRKLEHEPLSPADIQTLLAAARCPRDRVLVALLASTGMRIDEALWLQWRDIDLADGSVRVRAKPGFVPKSHHERTVFLSARAREVLEEYRGRRLGSAPADWVFKQQRADRRLTRAAGIGRELFKRARLYRPGDVWHELRRAAATGWLDAGVDLDTVRRLLGHSSIVVTQRYLRPRESAMRAAAERGLL